jgi:PiT family inorganic phosphate transporter
VTQNTIVADAPILLKGHAPARPKLDVGFDGRTALIFFGVLAFGLCFIAYSLYVDMRESGVPATSWLPFVLLGVALFIALGFEFVNGFHDTANAVATVIYTHSLPVHAAVVWSGLFNFLGVIPLSNVICTLPFVVERG